MRSVWSREAPSGKEIRTGSEVGIAHEFMLHIWSREALGRHGESACVVAPGPGQGA